MRLERITMVHNSKKHTKINLQHFEFNKTYISYQLGKNKEHIDFDEGKPSSSHSTPQTTATKTWDHSESTHQVTQQIQRSEGINDFLSCKEIYIKTYQIYYVIKAWKSNV